MAGYYTVIGSVAKGAEAESTGMSFNPWTFSFSVINILVLFLLLKLILFKPVTNYMNARADRIRKDLEEAQNNKAESIKIKNEYSDQLEKLKEDTTVIINNAHDRAKNEADEILNKAREEAYILIENAKLEGERQVQKALEEAKKEVATLAIMAASKVIEKNIDSEENRKLIQEFLDGVGAA